MKNFILAAVVLLVCALTGDAGSSLPPSSRPQATVKSRVATPGPNARYFSPTPGQFPLIAATPMHTLPKSTEEAISVLKTVKECGFNGAQQALPYQEAVYALEAADSTGLKLILEHPDLCDPAKCAAWAARFKDFPALGGFQPRDEPPLELLEPLAICMPEISKAVPAKLVYLNLAYAYPIGLKRYLPLFQRLIRPSVWSFDYYPYQQNVTVPAPYPNQKKGKVYFNSDFYRHLLTFSSWAKKTRRPMFYYFQTMDVNFVNKDGDVRMIFPEVSEAALRLEMFGALGYGAQGLLGWSYSLRNSQAKEIYSIAPIDRDGNKTRVWHRLKRVLGEVNQYSHLFLGASSVQTGHTGTSEAIASLVAEQPLQLPMGALASVAAGPEGVMCALLEKDSRNLIMVINHDVFHSQKVKVKFSTPVRSLTSPKAKASEQWSLSLRPGGYAIFEAPK